MQNLVKAHTEMFRRTPDECFPSIASLFEHCHQEKEGSETKWYPPSEVGAVSHEGTLALRSNGDIRHLSDWSFGQLCRLAEVSKDTANRLSPETVSRVFAETLPQDGKPYQVFAHDNAVRSLHGVTYTRLYNADLLSTAFEWATDFQPPQSGIGGGTGLYCGEQDMFCFLIDPTGWVEIDDQAFAPGFFIWNSEVGRRSVGVQTFWFQKVCQNHIVWDAVEVVEFTRKHTANVHSAHDEIRRILGNITSKRDERRDGFVQVIRKAMRERIGMEDEEALKFLAQHDINRSLAQAALKIACREGRFTIFSLVDALTQLSQRSEFAGDRTQADMRASRLLSLAA